MTVKEMPVPAGRVTFQAVLSRRAWIAPLLLAAVLSTLPFVLKLDGKPHADWQQFLGRFHPLAVHFPVALLVLVPLLEIAGAFRAALREAAGFVLWLAFLSCLGALTLGYLLAYGSGDSGAGVTRHMWGGIALSVGALVCVILRGIWASGGFPRAYPIALICVELILIWTAHQGGALTHGAGYLTQFMPGPLKRLAGDDQRASASTGPNTFYVQHVHPILDANCVACHGESKIMGGLRMDSYEWLMKGGKDGAVITAGHPETSLLLQRVTLPVGHKLFMPADGKPALKPEEIALIRAWVQQGASPTATSVAGIVIANAGKDAPLQPVGDYSSLMGEIRQMEAGQGAKLIPVSGKASDGLILSTVDVSTTFDDAQLAQFAKFAPYIVEAELGRTAVTDAAFDTLSRFSHLRALHLEGTRITGSGLNKLAPLAQLTYLNLSGTMVTPAAVSSLRSRKGDFHLYLYNTPAESTDTSQPVARATP